MVGRGEGGFFWTTADFGGLAALAALQRKKMLEKDLDKWTSTKNTIEQQVFALENANINLETMKAMQAGASAMKGIHGTLYSLLTPSPLNPPSFPNSYFAYIYALYLLGVEGDQCVGQCADE